ncbi:GH92 family glycosyl hydrolase [Terriglobus aquaticus]|uniref:GH92 family glycosyl hydrolase n=1 Tax=Terriglobus aquaticus TaxID=940139 RepID=A0ABW9KEY8_9BACT
MAGWYVSGFASRLRRVGVLAQVAQQDRAGEVDPFIGTSNGGNTFPGATLPFGMVQFSPEASPVNAKRMIASPGGYEFESKQLRGFSLTHVEGWGCAGGSGDVPMLPITEAVTDSPSKDFRFQYAVGFSHAQEKASPGLYQVSMANGVDVALTSGLRFGMAQLQFPTGKAANLLVRTSDSAVGSTASTTHIDRATNTIMGSVTSGNFCGYIGTEDRRSYYTLYFAAHFDKQFRSTGSWHDGTVQANSETAEGGTGYGAKGFPETGHGSGVWVGFEPGAMVHARIGISYVSLANAEANLKAESSESTTFDSVAAKARAEWNRRLNQIEVTGGTADQRRVFSTALYHSLQTPTTYNDSNGEYTGMDGKVHRLAAGQRTEYANFSGWDVYRSQVQLVTWLDPKVGSDIAQSLMNQSVEDGGRWDRWTHLSGATHVMNGDPAAPSVAGIWAFGGRDFDAKAALASLVHAAEVPTAQDLSHDGCPVECVGQRPGLDQYLKLHYIPIGAPAWGASADTLEDATADFSLSALAGHLGDRALQQRFVERAQYWRNLWNPKAAPDGGYIMNRNADGTWPATDVDEDNDSDGKRKPFTPSTGAGFVEGSAAQYVWMVPFNVAGLFDQMGGRETATARLDRFFYEGGKPAVTKAGPTHAELDNEPSIGTPWLYNYARQPWKTQQLVRQVLNTIWLPEPKGLPGNDDLGEMSSWAVFAYLGVYPAIPGRAELVVGSPSFPRAVVHRPAGDVVIEAPAASAADFYVQGLKVNGKAASKTWLPENFALQGGTLRFDLGAAPNENWGSHAGDEPPSFEAGRSR